MSECKICGKATRKGRQTCIGCDSVKKVVKEGDNASLFCKSKAEKHLKETPGLFCIAWNKLARKKEKQS